MRKNLAIYYFDGIYLYYDGDKYYEKETLEIPNGVRNVISYDCSFDINCRIYDIKTLEKLLQYEKGKSLNSIFQKYLHKTIGPRFKKENYPKHIYNVFPKLWKRIQYLNLEKTAQFEATFHACLNKINNKEFPVNKELINKKYEELEAKLKEHRNPFPGRQSLLKYMDKRKYEYFDIESGRMDLTHQRLLSFNDITLKKYIDYQKIVSERSMIQPYMVDKVLINHKPYCTSTGRVHTYSPNIQSLNPLYYSEKVISLDYMSQEILIYMQLFRPSIYFSYKNSEYNDFYEFLYCHLAKQQMQPGALKKKFPEKRAKMKSIVLGQLNDQGLDALSFNLGLDKYKLYPLYKEVNNLLEFSHNRKILLDVATKQGYYWANEWLGQFVKDEDLMKYQKIKWDAIEVYRKPKEQRDAKERGILIEAFDLKSRLKRRVVASNVQRTGSVVLKQFVMDLYKERIGVEVLCLKHDEIIIRDTSENNIALVKQTMEKAHEKVLNEPISVSVKRI